MDTEEHLWWSLWLGLGPDWRVTWTNSRGTLKTRTRARPGLEKSQNFREVFPSWIFPAPTVLWFHSGAGGAGVGHLTGKGHLWVCRENIIEILGRRKESKDMFVLQLRPELPVHSSADHQVVAPKKVTKTPLCRCKELLWLANTQIFGCFYKTENFSFI